MALMLREMQTSYGRNPGGYLWAILEPVGAIAMLTIVVAIGLRVRSPAIGTSFPLFFATGYLPFALAMQTAHRVATSLRFSRTLLAYPGVTFVDAIIARFLLSFLTHVMVFYVVIIGVHIAFDVTSIRDNAVILSALLMAGSLGLGLGVLNCLLFSLFPIWESTWSILTRPLFFISGILVIFENIPWKFQNYVWYNPVMHITGEMRRGFFPTYDAAYVSPLFVFGVSVVMLVVGLVFLRRYHRYILNQ